MNVTNFKDFILRADSAYCADGEDAADEAKCKEVSYKVDCVDGKDCVKCADRECFEYSEDYKDFVGGPVRV